MSTYRVAGFANESGPSLPVDFESCAIALIFDSDELLESLQHIDHSDNIERVFFAVHHIPG